MFVGYKQVVYFISISSSFRNVFCQPTKLNRQNNITKTYKQDDKLNEKIYDSRVYSTPISLADIEIIDKISDYTTHSNVNKHYDVPTTAILDNQSSVIPSKKATPVIYTTDFREADDSENDNKSMLDINHSFDSKSYYDGEKDAGEIESGKTNGIFSSKYDVNVNGSNQGDDTKIDRELAGNGDSNEDGHKVVNSEYDNIKESDNSEGYSLGDRYIGNDEIGHTIGYRGREHFGDKVDYDGYDLPQSNHKYEKGYTNNEKRDEFDNCDNYNVSGGYSRNCNNSEDKNNENGGKKLEVDEIKHWKIKINISNGSGINENGCNSGENYGNKRDDEQKFCQNESGDSIDKDIKENYEQDLNTQSSENENDKNQYGYKKESQLDSSDTNYDENKYSHGDSSNYSTNGDRKKLDNEDYRDENESDNDDVDKDQDSYGNAQNSTKNGKSDSKSYLVTGQDYNQSPTANKTANEIEETKTQVQAYQSPELVNSMMLDTPEINDSKDNEIYNIGSGKNDGFEDVSVKTIGYEEEVIASFNKDSTQVFTSYYTS
ncbi:hypothetical protein AYI70_g5941 [Smittium culicis]|uniref:Uncharacterized protein n=1 Tax=Smittium culicis TaxID=133412 RepID=A0A1R1XS43_9FUNG|nr:hypothetical protein AYI70_g5941 [Smittium culicis]